MEIWYLLPKIKGFSEIYFIKNAATTFDSTNIKNWLKKVYIAPMHMYE